jgi:hypothetical protein
MAMTNNDEKTKRTAWVEEVNLAGKDLVENVKSLVQQGNVRRLIIRRSSGETLLEVPLTATVIAGGALLVFNPMLAALGALAALVAEVKLEVVRELADGEEVPEGKRKVDIE